MSCMVEALITTLQQCCKQGFVVQGADSCYEVRVFFLHPHAVSILTAIFQINLGYPVFIETKDDGSGGDNWS